MRGKSYETLAHKSPYIGSKVTVLTMHKYDLTNKA